jgi:hypothetical protein
MEYKIAWFGADIPEFNLRCIASVKKQAEDAGHGFELIHDKNYTGGKIYASVLKDLLFMREATVNNELVFLDADITLHALPGELLPGKPYFEYCTHGPHIGYVMVNGCCSFFESLLQDMIWRNIDPVRGFTNKLLRGRAAETYQIDPSTFTHHMQTAKEILHGLKE